MKIIIIWYLTLLPAFRCADTQRFPRDCGLDNLVDQANLHCTFEEDSNMVNRVTKKEYEKKERLGANGTGKDRLKVLYQNGGAKEKTI